MLESFLFCVNALLPVLIIILVGFFLFRFRFFNDNFIKIVDKTVFNIALPTYLFNEILKVDIKEMFDLKLVLFCVTGIIASFIILSVAVPLFIKDRKTIPACVQAIFRSNTAILGIPLAENLYGSLGAATCALIIPFTIPLFNIFAVMTFTYYQNKDESKGIPWKKILLGIIKNPLIIAIAASLLCIPVKPYLPVFFDKSIAYIANLSTPLALLSLGASLDLREVKENLKLTLTSSVLRTVASPLIFLLLGVLIGLRGAELIGILVIFATPTAVSSYIMAKNMDGDYKITGQIIVLTTVMCFFTVFIASFILKITNLI